MVYVGYYKSADGINLLTSSTNQLVVLDFVKAHRQAMYGKYKYFISVFDDNGNEVYEIKYSDLIGGWEFYY